MKDKLKVIAISDTHNKHRSLNISEADMIVCCGDISFRGELDIIEDFAKWMQNLPVQHKITIFGNHEVGLRSDGSKRKKALQILKDHDIIYLEDSSCTVEKENGEKVKIYGTPYTKAFGNWEFALKTQDQCQRKWAQIHEDTNILLTHQPCYGILDLVEDNIYNIGRDLHQGCEDLLNRTMELEHLKVNIYGHLHLNGGNENITNGIKFINASVCDEQYYPSNKIMEFEI